MSGLEVQTREIENIHVICVDGYLDAHTATTFESSIEAAVKEKKVKIIINLEKCEYISSAGLGVFMGFLEEIREMDGDIKISNASEKVFKVFDLLGFPNIFTIVETEEEAKDKFLA